MTIKEKTTEELLTEINEKLDKLIGILAIQGKNPDQQIMILTSCGFTSEQIGSLLGLRAQTIRLKRSKKKKE